MCTTPAASEQVHVVSVVICDFMNRYSFLIPVNYAQERILWPKMRSLNVRNFIDVHESA